MNRRSLLKFLPGAAASVPVAIKAAAERMGMAAQWSPSAGGILGPNALDTGMASAGSTDHRSYLRSELSKLVSGNLDPYEKTSLTQSARCLDADLASLVSVSPSAAFVMQLERTKQRYTAGRIKAIKRELFAIARRSPRGE